MKRIFLALVISAMAINAHSENESDTRIIHIPVVNVDGVPAYAHAVLKLRQDGLLELTDIREYGKATDSVKPALVQKIVYKNYPGDITGCGGLSGISCTTKPKVIYVDRPVTKIVYKDRIVEKETCSKNLTE